MAQIENLERLNMKFKALEKKHEPVTVIVGYTASYGLFVHENLEASHKEGKQAKFLEEPARSKAGEIAEIVMTNLRRGRTMLQSLLMGGLFLQRESQELVPVLTGNLRASAFTRELK